jgi:hypothetical protein
MTLFHCPTWRATAHSSRCTKDPEFPADTSNAACWEHGCSGSYIGNCALCGTMGTSLFRKCPGKEGESYASA